MRYTVAAFLLGFVSAVGAQTIVLEPVADTALFESQSEQLSNALGPYLYVGRIQSGEGRRSLVRFDLSGIPASATITDASVTLTMDRTVFGPLNIDLLPVTMPWGEGTSDSGDPGGMGAPATAGDATWDFSIFPGTAWNTAGGDFASLSAQTIVDDPGEYTWSGPNVVADVEGWIANPATNLGWILLGNDGAGTGTAKRFSSREGLASPRLVITGTGLNPAPPPPPIEPVAVPAFGPLASIVLCLLLIVAVWRRVWA